VATLYRQRLDKTEAASPIPSPEKKVPNHITACWRPHRRELIAALSNGGLGEIWRIPLDGQPALLTRISSGIADLTVSPDDRALIYVEDRPDVNLWTVDLGNPHAQARRSELLSSTRDEFNPQYSPDGTRIAFESNRSGFPEIWINDRSGQHAEQITHFGGPVTGSPYWSPDGKWLTFDSRPNGNPTIFVIPSAGGTPRAITGREGPNVVPSWSHDGRWIYFASARSGSMQVWRVRPYGTDPSQITKKGGFAAIDAVDGRFVYYTKSRQMKDGLWRISLASREEEQVLPRAQDRLFAVSATGIYLATDDRGATVLARWPFGADRPMAILALPQPLYFGLAVAPDQREVMYGQLDARTKQLMRVDPLPQ
jgi:Tol biopolymer transport system component